MKSKQKATLFEVSASRRQETVNIPANGKSVQPEQPAKPISVMMRGSQDSRRSYYVLGEGGSGIATILVYKYVLQKRGVWAAEAIRYKAFDNDPRHKEQFAPEEFVDWSGVNLGHFLRAALAHPQQFPGLKRLGDLTSLLEALQPIPILIGGCRDNRRIGGALYERQAELAGEQVVADLMIPLNELRWAGNGSTAGNADLELLNIIQVFSGGGAKGNTAALADAWVIRHQLLATGYTKFRIDPVIYLPEVFKTAKQERIKANTHAFLVELAAVYTRPLPKMKIGPLWVERTPPYGLIKLLNGVDEQGREYQQDEVYAIEAECFRLSHFGPTGDFLESLIPNIVDELRWPYVGYSQNCCIKVLLIEELKRLHGLRHQKRLFETLAQQPRQADLKQQGKQLAQEWLRQHRLTPQDLSKLFLPELNSRQIAQELKPYRRLSLAAMELALTKYRQLKPMAWQEALAQAVDQQMERLETALIQWVGQLLNQPEYRPNGVRLVLDHNPEAQIESIAYFLADLKQMLKRKLAQAQTELDRQRAQTAKRPFILTKAFFKLFPRLRKRRWLDQTILALSLELLMLKLRAQIELVNRVERLVQSHSQAMLTWQTVLEQGSQMVEEQTRQYAGQRQHRPIFEENILSPAEEEALFAVRIDRALTLSRQGLTFQWQADQWTLQGGADDRLLSFDAGELAISDGLERFLAEYVIGFWKDLEELSLEAILESRGEDPVELITGMKRRCSPLISIDYEQHQVQGGQQTVSLRREYILGTQHGKEGLFQGYASPNGFEIVTTGAAGKYRLELLSTVFYVNPFALTQTGAYKEAYDRLWAGGHNPHIFALSELGLAETEVN
ncbi:MAG: hypothetical protein AB1801_08170 [Chloroflexota bacterium]